MNAPVLDREYVVFGDEKILLRRLASHHEYLLCEQLQRTIWGEQDIARVPLLDMVTAQENGGLVIGAFSEDDDLVGFAFSFLGLSRVGELKQCSVVAAVAPKFQNAGLGYQLKLFQAKLTAHQGIGLITWTFDPLSARNVAFNLNKLGARGVEYIVNAYGVGHGLNAGLETDRLLVSWRVPRDTDDEMAALTGYFRPPPCRLRTVNFARRAPSGVLRPGAHDLEVSAELLLVTVPADIYALSRKDHAVAVRWREVSREIFGFYLNNGYQAVRMLPGDQRDESIYVLALEGS
jgi:chorismate synthase